MYFYYRFCVVYRIYSHQLKTNESKEFFYYILKRWLLIFFFLDIRSCLQSREIFNLIFVFSFCDYYLGNICADFCLMSYNGSNVKVSCKHSIFSPFQFIPHRDLYLFVSVIRRISCSFSGFLV